MRSTTLGPTNRVGLAVLGLTMAAAGLAGLAVGSGQLGRLAPVGSAVPAADSSVVPPAGAGEWLSDDRTAVLFGLAGLVVALLGLGWLVLQIPRVSLGPRFQLHDDARAGVIRCEAKVVSAASAERLRQLADVTDAAVVVGGTGDHPTVRVDAEIDARAELPAVTAAVMERAAEDVAVALERPVDELAITLTVGQPKSSARYVVVESTDALPAR